jgi:hypothetical protein
MTHSGLGRKTRGNWSFSGAVASRSFSERTRRGFLQFFGISKGTLELQVKISSNPVTEKEKKHRIPVDFTHSLVFYYTAAVSLSRLRRAGSRSAPSHSTAAGVA